MPIEIIIKKYIMEIKNKNNTTRTVYENLTCQEILQLKRTLVTIVITNDYDFNLTIYLGNLVQFLFDVLTFCRIFSSKTYFFVYNVIFQK